MPQKQSTRHDIRLQVSILPSGTSVEISCHLLTGMLCSHFLRVGQRPHAARFTTGLCLVLELGPRAVPGIGFFSCEITEVVGTLLFAQATEAVNNSLTGFEASRLFNNKHFCVRANKNKYQLWRALLLLTFPWEDVAIGADLNPCSTLAFVEGIESSFLPSALCCGHSFWVLITSKACRSSHSDVSGAFA